MKKLNLLTACVFALFVLNASAVDGKEDANKGKNTDTPADTSTAKPWYSKLGENATTGVNEGVKDSVKDTIKDTVKSAYSTFILNPLLINPIKNLLFTSKSEKTQKNTAEILTLSEQIKKLSDSGVNRKYIAFLKAQLAKKIQDSTKNNSPKK